MIRTRTIKFEKIKVDIDFVRYYTLSDDTIQQIVSEYCTKHNIKLKKK